MRIISACFIFIFFSFQNFAQDNNPEYDEIMIYFNVPQVGAIEIPAVISNSTIFLPVTDIFTFLKLKNSVSPDFDSVYGYIISENNKYLIEKNLHKITCQEKTFNLKPDDIYITETNLYLKSNYFAEIFGLECNFTFRTLSVLLNTKLDLPVIREIRQEQIRKNLKRLKGEIKADTIYGRTFPLFRFGMADWSIISSQHTGENSDINLKLSSGCLFAGGESRLSLNYFNQHPFNEKMQIYNWRFVNNANSVLRQIMAGKIFPQTISGIYYPKIGFQLSNTPTTFRRYFGTYQISDFTNPGWIVELYVNNVLVDYVKADASGYFSFNVPLVYGSSNISYKFYGTWGEEISKENIISIPYNFLPAKEFEYSVSSGFIEDNKKNIFSRAFVNYGLSQRITAGGGVEFVSSLPSENTIPFFNISIRPAGKFFFNGEYAHDVRSKGVINFSLPSKFQLEINYTKYNRDQKAININFLEVRKFTASKPLNFKSFSGFSKFSLNNYILPYFNYTTAELMLTSNIFRVNTNLTTTAWFAGNINPLYHSIISFSFRPYSEFFFSTQFQYNYSVNKFISSKFKIEKSFFKKSCAFFSYEEIFNTNIRNFQLGFRYVFSFAQTNFNSTFSSNNISFDQSASGSLIYDNKTKYSKADFRNAVGRGGITLLPFLDLNNNGKYEKGEPKVININIRINNGRIFKNEKDTSFRLFDLEPYTSLFIEADGNNFDNIAWQIKKKKIIVEIEPNQLKLIEIPVSVAGEVSGMVFIKDSLNKKEISGIRVCFFLNDSVMIASTLTEFDGYFNFMGLKNGNYVARIDSIQLRKLKLFSTPAEIPFIIENKKDGDIIDNFEFIIKKNEED